MMNKTNLLTPLSLLRILVLSIGASLAVIGVVVALGMASLTSKSREAVHDARAALLATKSETEIVELQSVLQRRIDRYVESPEVMVLPEDQRLLITRELARTDSGEPASDATWPPIELTMSETNAIQDPLRSLFEGGTAFADAGVTEASVPAQQALANYFADPSPGNIRLLNVKLIALLQEIGTRDSELDAEAQLHEKRLIGATSTATIAMLVALTAIGVLILLLGRYITTRVRQAIQTADTEQMELAVATSHLQFRNDQLNALYNVFTEITDTLSLKYVVTAALRESIQIMRADMAVLRILRGTELLAAGAMTSTGQEIESLSVVKLGEGPTGRTAKRGRSLRIDSNGEQMMVGNAGTRPGMSPAEQSNESPLESGMIVPLVVGARVVGTLACWSRKENAFNEEDQRILEMMASQVANAIAAADATESSDRQAHQDPLTSLPNRRQLDEDLHGPLEELARQSRNAVVAMVDIDYFKRLNDDYGHHTGDTTLQRVASVLRNSVRDGDFVYRFGGEEFVVIFADTTESEAVSMAERLRRAVQALQLMDEQQKPIASITISIGLSLTPEHGKDVSALIDLADKAMYRAKSGGRNRVEVWHEEIAEPHLETVA
jgi:diguanylate cyclase (GGDEF)-like protein